MSDGEKIRDGQAIRDGQTMPLRELMMQFESLGDNCEFGLVQRHAGAEPLGLLRFASIELPVAQRLARLVTALDEGLARLTGPDNLTLTLEGEAGRREFMLRDRAYGLLSHTFVTEGQMPQHKVLQREQVRLGFLRRKLVHDLSVGEKIWVWKSLPTQSPEQLQPLLDCLGRLGNNQLLWVVEADDAHPPGSAQQLGERLFKGYVERFAPMDRATDISPQSWFSLCGQAYRLAAARRATPSSSDSCAGTQTRAAS